jgi:hypothetical protein
MLVGNNAMHQYGARAHVPHCEIAYHNVKCKAMHQYGAWAQRLCRQGAGRVADSHVVSIPQCCIGATHRVYTY